MVGMIIFTNLVMSPFGIFFSNGRPWLMGAGPKPDRQLSMSLWTVCTDGNSPALCSFVTLAHAAVVPHCPTRHSSSSACSFMLCTCCALYPSLLFLCFRSHFILENYLISLFGAFCDPLVSIICPFLGM